MKRYLYVIFLIIVCVSSWFSVVKDYKSGNKTFERFVAEAQRSYDKKMYKDAEEYYRKAISKRPKDEGALFGLAQTYFAGEKYKEAAELFEKLRAINPDEPKYFVLQAKSLIGIRKYSKALNLLNEVEQTAEVKKLEKDIKSKYSLKYFDLKEVKGFDICSSNKAGLSVAVQNDKACAYTAVGKLYAHGELSYLGPVSDDGELFPAVHEGEWCYVDKDGNRKLVPDTPFEFFGPFCGNLAVAKKEGVFGYVDKEFNEYNFKYDKAYNFSDGKAVVSEGGQNFIINQNFEVLTETGFTDVLADSYGYTVHFGKSVFISDGVYFLCDSNSAKISETGGEYIGLLAENEGKTEIMQNGLYGFLDSKTGDVAVSPSFEEAKGFSKGLAPVKVNGKWGFIDENGDMIVEPSFDFATSVSDFGTAWVKNKAGYALLTFYHLSEE